MPDYFLLTACKATVRKNPGLQDYWYNKKITGFSSCPLFSYPCLKNHSTKFVNGFLAVSWSGLHLRAQYIHQDRNLLPTFPNWLKPVYRPFGLSNIHLALHFCPDQPGRNQMYQKKQLLRSNLLIYVLWIDMNFTALSSTGNSVSNLIIRYVGKLNRNKLDLEQMYRDSNYTIQYVLKWKGL